jgi:hypothetical protein
MQSINCTALVFLVESSFLYQLQQRQSVVQRAGVIASDISPPHLFTKGLEVFPAFIPVLPVCALLDQLNSPLALAPAIILWLHSAYSPLGYGYL